MILGRIGCWDHRAGVWKMLLCAACCIGGALALG